MNTTIQTVGCDQILLVIRHILTENQASLLFCSINHYQVDEPATISPVSPAIMFSAPPPPVFLGLPLCGQYTCLSVGMSKLHSSKSYQCPQCLIALHNLSHDRQMPTFRVPMFFLNCSISRQVTVIDHYFPVMF